MRSEIAKLRKEVRGELKKVSSLEELDTLWVRVLGRKGKLTSLTRELGRLSSTERPTVGKMVNELRQAFETSFAEKRRELERELRERKLEKETLDITLPGKLPQLGGKHLITQIIEEVIRIFIGLGYQVAEGPEVELDYYNFEALNTPPDHPARSLQDTFYIRRKGERPMAEDVLLRTHTSPVQVRVMEKTKPPIYIIAPGRAYRHDVPDPTHSPMFHQIEGLAVDRNITFGDLKGTLEVFAREMFGGERKVRLRPHFFPFTEPSAEVDVSCIICDGKGCRVCKYSGWLEILGAGMVDPNVLENVGYDTEEITGFAFGMGVERIAMLKYGVSDIRLFFENDVRFLKQF
ncbi:MAG: phenylalanine--tRNA ligase subunit alpha [Actinomycetota bacterium]|nr:phenylalanine--tRNA ligase subunit alpha [Actinomycetota bacterium]